MPNLHRQFIYNAVVGKDDVEVNACRRWLDGLVPKIGMATLLPAVSVYCEKKGNEGITGFVVISTSHAAFHYWEPRSHSPNRLSFCLYSCGPFDTRVVVEHIEEFWSIRRSQYRLFDRTWDIVEVLPNNASSDPDVSRSEFGIDRCYGTRRLETGATSTGWKPVPHPPAPHKGLTC